MHSGDAMNDAAQVLAHAQRVREPSVREFEREAGDDQNDEAGEQNQMLPALIDRHARHEGIHACGGGRRPCGAR